MSHDGWVGRGGPTRSGTAAPRGRARRPAVGHGGPRSGTAATVGHGGPRSGTAARPYM
ncbi:MAG: hypothetical protein H6637_05000 [Ardenticatenales bacterium]|nr:hypothetical protein [Ardenticatenales bacterium]